MLAKIACIFDVKRRPENFHIQPITKVVSTSGFVLASNDVLMTYFAEWVPPLRGETACV